MIYIIQQFMKKFSIISIFFLLFSHVLAAQLNYPTIKMTPQLLTVTPQFHIIVAPPKLYVSPKDLKQQICPTLSSDDVMQMAATVLQNLGAANAFEQQTHLDGTSLRDHILNNHIASNQLLPRQGDAAFKEPKTLFIAQTESGEDIIQMLRQIAIITPIENCNLSYVLQAGVLRLIIQVPVNGLIYYENNIKCPCQYINICVKKVWVINHWSNNLTPATIYPTKKHRIQQQIINTELPNIALLAEYQTMEKLLAKKTPVPEISEDEDGDKNG
jgi:hypothetical protein